MEGVRRDGGRGRGRGGMDGRGRREGRRREGVWGEEEGEFGLARGVTTEKIIEGPETCVLKQVFFMKI